MVLENMGIVYDLAFRYQNANIELKDLISAGSIGLIKAVKKFNPEKGFKFSTFAYCVVSREMDYEISKNIACVTLPHNHRKEAIALANNTMWVDKYANNDEEKETFLNATEDCELDFFNEYTKKLKGIEKEVIILMFFNGITMKEIARRCGLSVQSISQIKIKALKKIKKLL